MKQVYWEMFLSKMLLQNQFLGNSVDEKSFWETFFGRSFMVEKFFGRIFSIVAKSFPRKQFRWKNFSSKIVLVDNLFGQFFFPLQNHLLKNYGWNKFWSKTFFGRNCFIVAKSFFRKRFRWKKKLRKYGSKKFLVEIFSGRIFFIVAKSFPR